MVNIPYTTFLLTTVCIVVHSIRFTDLDGLQAHRGRHSRDSESPEIRENTYQGQRARKTENTATKNLRLETAGNPAPNPKEPTTEYVPDAPRVPEVCMLEPDEGVCNSGTTRRDQFRYFFNPETEECEFFSYSGCNGNENNFKTEDQCKERCRAPTPTSTQAPDPTTEYVPDAPRLPEVCTLEPDEGVCDSGMTRRDEFRYFFNPETEECEFFSYSGCNGNGNNFKTEDQCKERCRVPTAPTPTSTPNPTEPTTEYVPDAPRLPALCMLEPEQGVCDSGAAGSQVFRYFFDPKTKKCEFFSYSGCNGNENNFETAEQCKERCQAPTAPTPTSTPNPTEPTTEYVPDAPRLPEVCMLEPDGGVCDSGMTRGDEFRYFFNHSTEECELFSYSGCNGNGNNFATAEQCKERCQGQPYDLKEDARLPSVCKERMSKGTCVSRNGPELRYLYNQYNQSCQLFTFIGGEGNGNNFKTREECEGRCLYTPDGECVLPPERGLCRENFTRYHWDKELGDCKAFSYSGCAGNANNFGSQEECQKFCKAKSTYLKLWKKVWDAMQSWMSRGYS